MTPAFLTALEIMRTVRALVIGDAMIDLYTDGTSTRQSPEAPVPVVLAGETRAALGGAANLAANLAALIGRADFLCVTGDDPARAQMLALGQGTGLVQDGFVIDPARPTATKHRYLANGTHVVRVDHEKTHALADAIRNEISARFEALLPAARVVVLSDYDKGVLPGDLIASIIARAGKAGVPVVVDSKKKDFAVFRGAQLAKPNKDELAARTGLPVDSDADVEAAARKLMRESGIAALMVSRAGQGVSLITSERAHHYAATARAVREVSGAGDTLLAVTAAALAADLSLPDAVRLGNIAAGLAVEKTATTIVDKEELRAAVSSLKEEKKSA